MIRLIRSELIKLRTTNMWWIFLLCSVAFIGLALLINTAQADSDLQTPDYLNQPPPPGIPEAVSISCCISQDKIRFSVPASRDAAAARQKAGTLPR